VDGHRDARQGADRAEALKARDDLEPRLEPELQPLTEAREDERCLDEREALPDAAARSETERRERLRRPGGRALGREAVGVESVRILPELGMALGEVEERLDERSARNSLTVEDVVLHRLARRAPRGRPQALRQIGAQLAAPTIQEWPSPEGATWQSWLADLARYYRGALRSHPDLIEFAHSALDPDFERLEHATRILVGFGFEPRAAGFAHGFVINLVVGYVQQEEREAEQTASGRSAVARYVQALATDHGVGRLATLASLALGSADFEPDAAFERFLRYAIDGIAAQPGAPT